MIYLLVGENEFRKREAVRKVAGDITPEIFDGSELQRGDLPGIFSGQTLFAMQRTIIVRGLSLNKSLWSELDVWLERVDADNILIFDEVAVDKRTKTYKYLQKNAEIIACDYWHDRDNSLARRWLDSEVTTRKLDIASNLRAQLIDQAIRPSDIDGKPVIDQQRLVNALDQLSGLETTITKEQIETILPKNTSENVFGLLNAALAGDSARVHEMCQRLAVNEDGFKVFGLIGSQVANLFALVMSGESADTLAGELGVSPFALRALATEARKINRTRAKQILTDTTETDRRLKLGGEPWSLIETLLQKIALG